VPEDCYRARGYQPPFDQLTWKDEGGGSNAFCHGEKEIMYFNDTDDERYIVQAVAFKGSPPQLTSN
jgi:hypothetical protein